MKPPQFDGNFFRKNYQRQFKSAARVNLWTMTGKTRAITLALRGEATDMLQTLSSQKQTTWFDLRYGQAPWKTCTTINLNNRIQKQNESL